MQVKFWLWQLLVLYLMPFKWVMLQFWFPRYWWHSSSFGGKTTVAYRSSFPELVIWLGFVLKRNLVLIVLIDNCKLWLAFCLKPFLLNVAYTQKGPNVYMCLVRQKLVLILAVQNVWRESITNSLVSFECYYSISSL